MILWLYDPVTPTAMWMFLPAHSLAESSVWHKQEGNKQINFSGQRPWLGHCDLTNWVLYISVSSGPHRYNSLGLGISLGKVLSSSLHSLSSLTSNPVSFFLGWWIVTTPRFALFSQERLPLSQLLGSDS